MQCHSSIILWPRRPIWFLSEPGRISRIMALKDNGLVFASKPARIIVFAYRKRRYIINERTRSQVILYCTPCGALSWPPFRVPPQLSSYCPAANRARSSFWPIFSSHGDITFWKGSLRRSSQVPRDIALLNDIKNRWRGIEITTVRLSHVWKFQRSTLKGNSRPHYVFVLVHESAMIC